MQTSANSPILETAIIAGVALVLLFCVAVRGYRRSHEAPAVPRPFDLPLWPLALSSIVSALACLFLPILWKQLQDKGAFPLWQLHALEVMATISSTIAIILEIMYPISLAADQKPIIRLIFTLNAAASALYLGVTSCKLFDRGLEIIWALPLITHLNTTACFAVAHNSALSAAKDKQKMLVFMIFSTCITMASAIATLPAFFGYNETHFALQNCLCLFFLVVRITRFLQNSFQCTSVFLRSLKLRLAGPRFGASIGSETSFLPI